MRKTYAQQLDLLRFQVNEIDAARLQPAEEAQVEQGLSPIQQTPPNSSKLSQAALDLLSENDSSLLTQAGAIGRTLHELQRIDPAAAHSGDRARASCFRPPRSAN